MALSASLSSDGRELLEGALESALLGAAREPDLSEVFDTADAATAFGDGSSLLISWPRICIEKKMSRMKPIALCTALLG